MKHRTIIHLVVICLALPFLAITSTLVLLTAGRPLFYTQKRVGEAKRPFLMYKFRTMYVGAHKHQKKLARLNQAPGPMFKIFDDPRFVGVGRFLSRSGLDELPQLLNVLKGEMNLVGPRPLPVTEAKALDSSWDFRYTVKPGIFSEWTASPLRHRNLLLWKELDRLTVQNCSTKHFWYSFHLIIKTLWQQLR